jgi:hypothetical protein
MNMNMRIATHLHLSHADVAAQRGLGAPIAWGGEAARCGSKPGGATDGVVPLITPATAVHGLAQPAGIDRGGAIDAAGFGSKPGSMTDGVTALITPTAAIGETQGKGARPGGQTDVAVFGSKLGGSTEGVTPLIGFPPFVLPRITTIGEEIPSRRPSAS